MSHSSHIESILLAMTVMPTNLFIDGDPSKDKYILFLDGNYFLIASTVSEYSLWQMSVRVLGYSGTISHRNVFYSHCTSWFHIVFHGIWNKTDPSIGYKMKASVWNSPITMPYAVSLGHYVCQLSSYRSNLNVKYEFPLWTYYFSAVASVCLENGQCCFIDNWNS